MKPIGSFVSVLTVNIPPVFMMTSSSSSTLSRRSLCIGPCNMKSALLSAWNDILIRDSSWFAAASAEIAKCRRSLAAAASLLAERNNQSCSASLPGLHVIDTIL